jgi:hypothetical protein
MAERKASERWYGRPVGFLDKLKQRGRGVMTAAKPEEGVPAASPEEVET